MWSTSSSSASSSIERAGLRVLVQQRADRVGDLLPAAVADRDVDREPAPVHGPLGRGLEHVRGLRRQQVERADQLDPPAGCRSAARSSTSSSMIRSSGCSSASGRDRLSVDSSQSVTTSTPASAHQRSRSSILSAPAWWPKLTSPAPRPRPAPVAVAHDPDVAGHRTAGQLAAQPPFVHRVEQVTRRHPCTLRGRAHRSGPFGRGGVTKTAPEIGGSPHAAAQPASVTSDW